MRILILLIGVSVFLSSCSGKEKDTNAEKYVNTIYNPNGDSELALLMRQMHDDAAKTKESITANTFKKSEKPGFLDELKTATPTNQHVTGPVFNAFADAYIHQMELLFETDQSSHQFNEVITSCINCHQEYCFGPIEKIKKLRIKEAS